MTAPLIELISDTQLRHAIQQTIRNHILLYPVNAKLKALCKLAHYDFGLEHDMVIEAIMNTQPGMENDARNVALGMMEGEIRNAKVIESERLQ
ncbi:MAG: hypothetical protein GY804_11540 [Alphaproteobacteria bacterium]|nr:hypothetical protein [Alphaproteobacteria bacterium]